MWGNNHDLNFAIEVLQERIEALLSYNSLPHRDEECLNCVQHVYSNAKSMKLKLEC